MNYATILEETNALEAILPRVEEALERGANFLMSSMAPKGPILSERNVSYCHKVSWGLFEAGRIAEVLRILDWLKANAERSPGEYYFPEEQWYEKDMQRVYRALTFGKVAEYLRHPAFANDEVRGRLCEYQHSSGGVAACIDDGFPQRLEPLNTSFFGQWALAAGLLDRAKAAGNWIVELVALNEKYFEQEEPLLYYNRDRDTGTLVTEIPTGQRMNTVIDTKTVKQPSWVTGTCMALLADLYAVTQQEEYLTAALRLAEWEDRCDPAQLFWPSKCKVGWGAAELYGVTLKPAHRRIAANVARVTFMASQRADGGWSHMFYPLSDDGAWREIVYADPSADVLETLPEDGSFCWLSRQEITGEFLGELGRTRAAFRTGLTRLRELKTQYEKGLKLGT